MGDKCHNILHYGDKCLETTVLGKESRFSVALWMIYSTTFYIVVANALRRRFLAKSYIQLYGAVEPDVSARPLNILVHNKSQAFVISHVLDSGEFHINEQVNDDLWC